MIETCRRCQAPFERPGSPIHPGASAGLCPACSPRTTFWERKLPVPLDGWLAGTSLILLFCLAPLVTAVYFWKTRPASILPKDYWAQLSEAEQQSYLHILAIAHGYVGTCDVLTIKVREKGASLEFLLDCSSPVKGENRKGKRQREDEKLSRPTPI